MYGTPGDLEVYVGNRQLGERVSRWYAAAGQPRPPEECTPLHLDKLARAGDRIAIASYLGGSDVFDRAIAEFAAAYADQNERDFEALTEAAASGRITAERGV